MVNEPIRILHVFGAMNRGGAETLIMNVYRNINRQKIQFDFLVNTDDECHYDKEIQKMGGRIFHISKPRKGEMLIFLSELKKIIKINGPFNAIHSHVHHFSGFILFVAKYLEIPIRVSHSHNVQDGKKESKLRNGYRFMMEKLIKKYSTNMLGCSNAACESLFGENCWNDDRVEMMPNALNFSDFDKISCDKFTLREKLKLPKSSKLIAHVGRFETQKNHKFLIDLFYEILKGDSDFCLVLVGDGVLKNEISRLVNKYNMEESVFFLGVREDVPEIMKAVDLFLFPSLYEGLGNVLIEAQAAGVQSITSTGTPRDADLNMGLLKFIDLNDSINVWASEILNSVNMEPLNKEEIKTMFLTTGYNIEKVSHRLGEIYASSR